MGEPKSRPPKTITVAGVKFSADQIKSAVLLIDGREIFIQEKGKTTGSKQIGFPRAKKKS